MWQYITSGEEEILNEPMENRFARTDRLGHVFLTQVEPVVLQVQLHDGFIAKQQMAEEKIQYSNVRGQTAAVHFEFFAGGVGLEGITAYEGGGRCTY